MRVSVLALFSVALSTLAETKIWTNSNGGGWSVAANWSPNGAPSAADHAVITNSGTYTVRLDASTSLAGLMVGGGAGTQSLATAGQTLALNGQGRVASSGRLLLEETLSGTNHLIVEGQMAWSNGTVGPYATVEISAQGSLVIGGGAEFAKVLQGSITNAGTITHGPYGPLVISGTLCNLKQGRLVIQSPNRSIARGQPTALLVNDGLLQVSPGAVTCEVPLVNSGTLDVPGAALILGDGCVFNDGSRFTGGGVIRLESGTNQLNGRIYSDNLLFQGASLTGTASLSGNISWGAGYIDYGAAFLVATNGQLIIGGGANYGRGLRGSLTNAGLIVYAPPGPLGLAGPLHNLQGGLFDVRWNSTIFKSGPAGVFINEGTLRRSEGTAGTSCEVPLINHGTVEAQTGAFIFGDGCVFSDGSRFIGAGVTRLESGTNVLSGKIYSENLLFQGANLTGTASLSGAVNWGAGYIDYGAAFLVPTNGQLFIGGGANYARVLRGNLTNAGLIVYAPPGPWGLAGPMHILPGGLVDVQWNSTISKSGPAGVIVNEGTLRRSEGTAGTTCEVPLINHGTVEAQVGAFVFGDGCVFNDGSRFTGAGVTRLEFGTNLLSGKIYSENLLFDGASLTGKASLSGLFVWRNGYIDYGAAFLVATNGQLVIGGGANNARVLRGGLTNAGAIFYDPPGAFCLAGPLHNLPGGLFEIRWDYHLSNCSPEGAFINDGTCRKSAGAATTECLVPFVNRGTLDLLSGRFYFSASYAQPSGDLLLRSGSVRSDRPLNLAGGRLLGWGTVEADLNNAGATVSPSGSNGVITITGNYAQQVGGTCEFQLAGTNAGVNLSHLRITGAASLSGTVAARLVHPYLPPTDSVYPVMSFSSRRGDFARRNGLILLGHNLRLVTSYGPKAMSLVSIAQPDPEGVPLQIGFKGNAALVSWPLEFGGGTLYACTNLVAPAWVVLPTIDNSFLDQPMTTQRYFRLSIP